MGEGEVLGIVGPNGSGKTTLLRCINMVLKPKAGTVLIDGQDILELDRKEIAKSIGVVPQNSNVRFPFTVLDVVLMGRTPHMERLDRESLKDIEVAKKAMEMTNTEHLADRLIDEVSGGEKQRVIIARALAQEPKILLLDEPTLHLDINHQLELLELIRELSKRNSLVVILVSHDLNLAARYCDRMILLSSGKIHSAGRPSEVLTPENIKEVYQVVVEVSKDPETDAPHILLKEPVKQIRSAQTHNFG